MKEFSPLEAFEQALRNWWLIILVAIWGAAVGWLVHSLRQPLYEATVHFSVSVNFTETGRLTQFEEDHAWNIVGDLLGSTNVLEQVAQQAQQQGVATNPAELSRITSKERREYIFLLRVRYHDPQTAALLANIWGIEAERQLVDAYGHAQKAETLQRYMHTLEDCLSKSPTMITGTNNCGVSSLSDLQGEIKNTSAQLSEELLLSRGIIPSLSFSLSKKADVPQTPVALGTNSSVFAGALVGFLIGVIAVQVRLPERLARSLRHA